MSPTLSPPTTSTAAFTVAEHGPDACCVVRDVLSRIGDKWSMVTINALGERSLRFGELRRRGHGISQRMLTHTLRQLERDGLVWRKVTPTVPVTVEYGLTDLGRCLLVVLSPLFQWTVENTPTIQAARADYDARAAVAAGHDTVP